MQRLSFIVVEVLAASACGTGSATSSDGGLADGASDAAPGDAAANDAADGGAGACSLMNSAYDRSCATAADCAVVARGCYCGAQPVIGIAKSALATANACEATARDQCALGCPNAPGHVAEDGKNDQADGGTIQALCDSGMCHTVLR